jgi:hypothetical protein
VIRIQESPGIENGIELVNGMIQSCAIEKGAGGAIGHVDAQINTLFEGLILYPLPVGITEARDAIQGALRPSKQIRICEVRMRVCVPWCTTLEQRDHIVEFALEALSEIHPEVLRPVTPTGSIL